MPNCARRVQINLNSFTGRSLLAMSSEPLPSIADNGQITENSATGTSINKTELTMNTIKNNLSENISICPIA